MSRAASASDYRLFVATPLLPRVRALIAGRREARFNPGDAPMPLAEIVRAAEGAGAVMISPRDPMDAAAIAMLPASVRTIATYSVGHDHIDLAAAAARGLNVVNTPDVLTDAVAEVAILLMLGAARRGTESIDLLRQGRWTGWTPLQLPGVQITGRRIGIYGMGRIGQRIAHRARGFDMKVHYRSRRRLPAEAEQDAQYHASDESFFAASQVLVLACPATPETRGLLNAGRIAWLPHDAVVVNIARGSVVDDDALIAALAEGRIAAAGLDVFNNEPALDPRYLDLPNAFLMPHIGSSTIDAREQMAATLLDALDAIDRGEIPLDRLVTVPRAPA
jgi:lactate dehydrogenase-like 2-hydroxyacid dehydrogenase